MIYTIADLGNNDVRVWEWDSFDAVEIGSTKYFDHNGVETTVCVENDCIYVGGVAVSDEDFVYMFTKGGYYIRETYREFKPYVYYNGFGGELMDIYVGY